jgi:hypothetical protein
MQEFGRRTFGEMGWLVQLEQITNVVPELTLMRRVRQRRQANRTFLGALIRVDI